LDKAAPAVGVPTHVGGVVFRMQSGRAEFLKDRQDHWLPLKKPIATASHHESHELLSAADLRRAALKGAAAPVESALSPTTDD
jgi:hypothetical protein